MAENASQTLREYLDMIHIGPGDDSPLVIVIGNLEMNVSRRYLESSPWQRCLEMIIVDYRFPYTNIYGTSLL